MQNSNRVVRCAIHPALGIARIGNAPVPDDPQHWEEGFYIASELPGVAASPKGGFKTPDGKIKRGAARFRIFGYDADGNVVKEITSSEATIVWRVHVANRKSAWYRFYNAMDMTNDALATTHRNADICGALRQQLVIDPGLRRVSGNLQQGRELHFDTGFIRFPDAPQNTSLVYLGELRTDEAGRLLFLGGVGRSCSVYDVPPSTFANNDGWYDDTSDGTVRATVVIDGQEFEADPAMVAVAPPNYAPGIFPVVTMWDVVHDVFLQQGWVEPPQKINFSEHIEPIFSRLVDSQWVNDGMYFLFGAGSPSNLTESPLRQQLADPSDASKDLRTRLFEWFRRPPQSLGAAQPDALPPFYGDGYAEFQGTYVADLALTATQYAWLREWAAGNFHDMPTLKPQSIDDYPVDQQPALIDRAPLEECLGGPFHPGIELTWTLRMPQMWQRAVPSDRTKLPYRLNILPEGQSPRDDYGDVLTPQDALGAGGPTDGSGPGSLTRWQGVPWQTDEASCLAGYDPSAYLSLPSFWAARVPNTVLSEKAYQRVLDTKQPIAQRAKHLAYRQFWLRDIDGSSNERRGHMVSEWDKMGIITQQPPPADYRQTGLPERFWVETGRDVSFDVNDPTYNQVLMAESLTTPTRDAAAIGIKAIVPARHPAAAVNPAHVVGHPLRRKRNQETY